MPLLLTGDRACPTCGERGPAIRGRDVEYPTRVGGERPAVVEWIYVRYERCGHRVEGEA